jgi:hypothetical protein
VALAEKRLPSPQDRADDSAMSPLLPITVIALLLIPPAVAFYLTVEVSRRRLLASLRTVEDVERALTHKPWYVSRGQLVAWEYLIMEADTSGGPGPLRHLSRVGPTGRRLWIVWQGAQPTPLFHPWTSAAVFAVGGLVLVLPAYRNGATSLALAEAVTMVGLCGYLVAAGRLQRDDEDWKVGAKLRPLLSADADTRVAGLREIAALHAPEAPAPAVA